MSKKRKILLIILGSFLLMAAAVLIFGTRGMDTVRQYTIENIDLNRIDDGVYQGEFAQTRWGVAVSVEVKDHLIKKITITDRKSSNITKDIIEQLNKALLETDEPNFDAVSGATMTSKGYLIAVADALKK